tara:strand:+ start:794 stop:1234 length:441 start_codon:yes stop_codon:yes gene_type:complete
MKYYNNNLALKEQGRKKTVFTKVIRLKSKLDYDKQMHLNWVVRKVEKGTGLTKRELKSIYSEKSLFYEALKYVSTTSRSLCVAFNLSRPNCCRHKKDLESRGLLIQSVDKYVCRNSYDLAHVLSTNQNKFDELLKSNQLKFKFSYE